MDTLSRHGGKAADEGDHPIFPSERPLNKRRTAHPNPARYMIS